MTDTTPTTPDAPRRRRPPAALMMAAVVSGLVVIISAVVILTASDDDTAPAADDPLALNSDVSRSGELAPTAEFFTFDGESVTLADFAGTPLVVNFFASWCGPCVDEMPVFQDVSQQVGDEVVFLGVNEYSDAPADGLKIVEETGVTYRVFRDDTGDLFRGFGALGMPTTAFIDAAGNVIGVHSGLMLRDQLEENIAELLAG